MNHELHDIDVIFYGHWINSWVILVETELLAVWCSQSTTVSEDDFAKSMTKKNSVLELYISRVRKGLRSHFLAMGIFWSNDSILDYNGISYVTSYSIGVTQS